MFNASMGFFREHARQFDLPPDLARPRLHLVLLWGALLLGAALRLHQLGAWALWYDETASIYLTRYVGLNLDLFDDTKTTEAPLLALLVFFWKGLVDTLTGWAHTDWRYDFAMRLFPCAFSVATLPLLYRVGLRVLQDRWAALAAVYLAAISPFMIYYAQELRIYAFYTFFALAALWFLLRALDEDQPRHWAGMIACLALIMYGHFFAMWTIFSFGVFYVVCLRHYGRYFWKWTAWFALLMLIIAPALVLASRMNAHVLELKLPWYAHPDLKTALITFKDFYAGFGPTSWAYWPLFALALLLFALGVFSLRRRYPAMMLITVFVIIPIAGNVLLWASRDFSFYQHRLFIFSGLISMLGVGAGLRLLRPMPLQPIALAVLSFLTAPMLRDYYQQRIHFIDVHKYGINYKVDFRALSTFIDERYEEGDLVIAATHFPVYSLHHYLQAPFQYVSIDAAGRQYMRDILGNAPLLEAHGLMPEPVAQAVADRKRIWFVESYNITFEHKPHTQQVRAWIEQQWVRTQHQEFNGLTATLYERRNP